MSFQFVVFGFLWVLMGGASLSGGAMEKYHAYVENECGFTTYPSICVETVMGLKGSFGQHDLQHVDIVSALVNKTIYETQSASSEFSKFSSQLSEVREAQPAHDSVKDYCEELMGMSLKRLDQSLIALKKSPSKNKQDIQAWLSATITFQETCKDYVADHGLGLTASSEHNLPVNLPKRIDYASQLGSNLLALVNRVSSTGQTKNTASDKQAEVFPKWVSTKDRKLLQATTVRANVVVAKDGSGNYRTVSEAIQAASGGRFVIYVKSGVYKEKIRTNKAGITLIGDGPYSTIITWDDSVAKGASMPGSATFTVTGDGFIARDIGFQNTAGPDAEQALALYISSDHSVLFKCSIAAYQDTLYALALRQFYRDCDIHGSIDFIFGNAAAVFQNCNLIIRGHKGYNAIMANGRSDPGQSTGFSVQSCKIMAGSDLAYSSYLGRPWKAYSRAVVMQSNIDNVISPRGWVEWPGAGGSSLKSLYFAEFANMGTGAGVGQRVKWPGYHVIGADVAVKYTVGNFIGGTSWLPSTGVTFVSGLH